VVLPAKKKFFAAAIEEKEALVGELGRSVRTIVFFIAAIWLIGVVDVVAFGGRLQAFGIRPRTVRGLVGILCAPFLHGGIFHLIGNTTGILVFGGLVILRRETNFWAVTGIGALASGFGIWLFGRPVLHIGASGIIFAYFGYLLFSGWFERRIGSLVVSMLVFVLWGSMLFGILPIQRGISWEGHLFGLMGGAAAAWLLARRRGAA
jgi:membrane associated rhomboid family serine protease